MLRGQILQHIFVGGCIAFRSFAQHRLLQFLVEDVLKLFWGTEVSFLSGHVVNIRIAR